MTGKCGQRPLAHRCYLCIFGSFHRLGRSPCCRGPAFLGPLPGLFLLHRRSQPSDQIILDALGVQLPLCKLLPELANFKLLEFA